MAVDERPARNTAFQDVPVPAKVVGSVVGGKVAKTRG